MSASGVVVRRPRSCGAVFRLSWASPPAILAMCFWAATTVNAEIYFFDPFEDMSQWKTSYWKGADLMGSWNVSKPHIYLDGKQDKMMHTIGDNRFFGISAAFPTFSNRGKKLVVQYEVKANTHWDCGGAYLKIGPTFGGPDNDGKQVF